MSTLVEKIDPLNRAHVKRFVDIPFRIYRNIPQWVPPIRIDIETQLNPKKHPFYEHSDAEFFIAVRDGQDVGRIAALENRRFNDYHGTRLAQFYFFETEENQETAAALFDTVFEWARKRGLSAVVGPKGFGPLDGYGLLVEGFEHRQLMAMLNYNPSYYPPMVEQAGFEKEVDFLSCYANTKEFKLPERIESIAKRVQGRGTLTVKQFANKKELMQWADRIGEAYNKSFVNNWEYYPLTEREVKFITDNSLAYANPKLIKIILHGEDVVGFLFAFPDVSAAIQRSKGKLLPFGLIDLLLEMRRTNWVAVNGTGILPEFQGRGGNALMYSEMVKTILTGSQFVHADLTQVAETAVNMRRDLINLGGKPYKTHRVYHKKLDNS